MKKTVGTHWTLVPASARDIAQVRARCRALVRRRALVAAGMSALPLPGVDVMSDLGLFAALIDEINREFGMTPGQIGRLRPEMRLAAYEVAAGMGAVMVGKLITRALVARLFRRGAATALAKTALRLVPVAGQVASAALGYAVFRAMGDQHVEACAAVARELVAAAPA